jgi:aminoglycoside/choline kinase family phosphotransferase
MALVPTIDEIDARWFAEHLTLSDVTHVTASSVGHGQVANCYRLVVERGDAPATSFIAKVPSLDAVSRSTATLQHLYEREVSFYQLLASNVSIRTPQCFFAGRDEKDNFLLILEDLTPAALIDQFGGINVEVARHGLDALAGLHGPTHALDDLHSSSWLRGVSEELAPLYASVLPGLFDQFLDRYDERLDDELRTLVTTLRERLAQFSNYATPHPCVTHGDFRTDNLLIDACDGAVPLAVVDWQTVGVGSPLLDVAYFLTTSLSPDDCVRHETELIDYYLDAMSEQQVRISRNVAHHEFARYTLQPIVMLVAASVIVEQTPRGDEMFLSMIARAVVAATRWNALDELERHAAS